MRHREDSISRSRRTLETGLVLFLIRLRKKKKLELEYAIYRSITTNLLVSGGRKKEPEKIVSAIGSFESPLRDRWRPGQFGRPGAIDSVRERPKLDTVTIELSAGALFRSLSITATYCNAFFCLQVYVNV